MAARPNNRRRQRYANSDHDFVDRRSDAGEPSCGRGGLRDGRGLLRSMRTVRMLRPADLPNRLRNEAGDENLLVRRVPRNLPLDAGVSSRLFPRLLRLPASALRTSPMREEAG